MTVYKYCSSKGLHILEHLQLKITPPNEFNDPFEFTPRVICSNPSRRIKRLFKDKREIRDWYLQEKREGFAGSFRDFRNQVKAATPTLIDQLTPKLPDVSDQAQKEYLQHISTTYGVLCLSERADSILMWGHYCDSYRGLVIGFDGSHHVFTVGKGLRPVTYVRERVLLDTNWKRGGAAEKAFTDAIIFSKNADWAYERELRQFFLLSGLMRRRLDGGPVIFLYEIPPEAITSVILGPRCSADLRTRVAEALRRPMLAHVELQEARLHPTQFQLNIMRRGDD